MMLLLVLFLAGFTFTGWDTLTDPSKTRTAQVVGALVALVCGGGLLGLLLWAVVTQ